MSGNQSHPEYVHAEAGADHGILEDLGEPGSSMTGAVVPVEAAATDNSRLRFLSVAHTSQTLRTVAVFGSGNLIATLLGMVGSLVQARYLPPEEMGIYRRFMVVTGYLTFLHLGVFDGLQREIPIQFGRGRPADAMQAAGACLSWIAFVWMATAAVFLALATRAAYAGDWMQFWGWLAFVPVLGTTFYGGYLGTTYRTRHDFVALSKASVVQSILGTAALPLLPMMGYYGACLRNALTSGLGLAVLHKWRPLRVRPTLDWWSFKRVIGVGLPLSAIGYLSTSLWTSFEGTLVLAWFGNRGLGLYSMAIFVRVLCSQLAQNLNQVLNVRIYEQYGRTRRAEDCLRLVLRPLVVAVGASIPVLLVAWVALPKVVLLVMPNYREAVQTMQLMLASGPITLLSLPTAVLWAAVRRMDCLAGVGSGFITFVATSYLLSSHHYGILAVVIGSIFGQLVNLAVCYALLTRLVLHDRHADSAPASARAMVAGSGREENPTRE
jgi:O-antigen/teichoic acid export membrane protein